jgi:cellulose synthase/poly-beta-1,6-N-acetylglucosamine synthase-like glycosyltransferase
MELFLIISTLIIIHGYGGYILPILVSNIFKKRKSNTSLTEKKLHKICIVIAAYNEASFIEKKITNTLAIDFPKELLDIIIVTDGSTDKTFEIASQFKEVRCFHQKERLGKMAAIDRIMPFVNAEITVFTDANTLLNKDCLQYINMHFNSSAVGGVAGEKRVKSVEDSKINQANQEGVYWKYESFLKQIDSDFHSVVGAAGELYAIRTSLYEFPGRDVILDDFIISMSICKKGYVFIYEPKAYAIELPSSNIKEEAKRKIRIGAGGIQSIIMLKAVLNVFKFGKLSYLFLSHRVLRWSIIPFLLILVFILNFILLLENQFIWLQILFMGQLIFYGLGCIGFLKPKIKSKLTTLPNYFIFMNIAQFKGIVRFFSGQQTSIWEKAERLN